MKEHHGQLVGNIHCCGEKIFIKQVADEPKFLRGRKQIIFRKKLRRVN